MSKKHKSRLETLRDCAPEMLSVIRSTRAILRNALNDDYFDREVFERLQKRVIAVLDLAVDETGYVPHVKVKGGEA